MINAPHRNIQHVSPSRIRLLLLWPIAQLTALVLGLTLLAGCAEPVELASGSELADRNNPESVVINYFEDLGRALKDPQLVREERREYWVEQLAGYFAPNERNDQRLALQESLSRFASDVSELAEGETLTLELRGFKQTQRLIAADGQSATIVLPDATVYMLITRASERGPIVVYEQPIEFNRVIGSPTKSVPLVKIGGRWYLTEG
ncbi:MAG: hypothetical protein RLZZ387_2730 [Chloroflexota bacterium]